MTGAIGCGKQVKVSFICAGSEGWKSDSECGVEFVIDSFKGRGDYHMKYEIQRKPLRGQSGDIFRKKTESNWEGNRRIWCKMYDWFHKKPISEKCPICVSSFKDTKTCQPVFMMNILLHLRSISIFPFFINHSHYL